MALTLGPLRGGQSHGRKVAETEGFEPSVPHSGHDGLANRWFQPLTHVSALLVAGGAIASLPALRNILYGFALFSLFIVKTTRLSAKSTRLIAGSLRRS